MEKEQRISATYQTKLNSYILETKKHIEEWKILGIDNFSITKMLGFSNSIYKIALSDKINTETPLQAVILRIFGNQPAEFINKDQEILTFNLMSVQDLGPKQYILTDTYRIEEFINGRHPRAEEQTHSEYLLLVSFYLASLHNVQYDRKQFQHEPKIATFIQTQIINAKQQYFQTLAIKIRNKFIQNQPINNILLEITQWLTVPNLENLATLLSRCYFKEKLSVPTFCHNDLNNLNIFIQAQKQYKEGSLSDTIKFIDFEYANTNFPLYDIANFFNEMTFIYNDKVSPFFEHDPKQLPSEDKIKAFIFYYVHFRSGIYQHPRTEMLQEQKTKESMVIYQEVQKDAEALYEQLDIFFTLCNLYWMVWALEKQIENESEFYIYHAKARLDIIKSKLSQILEVKQTK